MMLLKGAREKIVYYGQKMMDLGLNTLSSGNISIIDRDQNLIALTPSAIEYDLLQAEDILIINQEGLVIEGNKKPSSEIDLHFLAYKKRKDINACVHNHSIYATTFACLKKSIMPVHYMIVGAAKEIKCAEYAAFGSKELAQKTIAALGQDKAILMANHGLLAVGDCIEEAFSIACNVEYVAQLYYQALNCGTPNLLSKAQLADAQKRFKDYQKP